MTVPNLLRPSPAKLIAVFGPLSPGGAVAIGAHRLRLETEGGIPVYVREHDGVSHVRKLVGPGHQLVLHPVEPLRLPEEITRYLELSFDPLVVGPGEEEVVHLLFPFDLGVFVCSPGATDLIDLFSLNSPKFSLYGPLTGGFVTRWHRSPLSVERPRPDPCVEGILRLSIRNQTRDWVEVGRAVFDCGGMKLWFGDRVGMVASMRILRANHAETEVQDEPLVPGWTRAMELMSSKRIPGLSRPSCTMEAGVR